MSHIRMSHPYGETPPNFVADYEWLRANETALLKQYGETAILVYEQQVIGVGQSYQEAIAVAERNLSPDAGEITPIFDWLVHRNPLMRALPGALDTSLAADE